MRNDNGFSLMEAIIATVIAVIAVLGLAYTFSVGRAQIDRFEVARAALVAAQDRMERLTVLPATAPELEIGMHPETPIPFVYEGVPLGTHTWKVEWFYDPGTASMNDLKRVTVEVGWSQSSLSDTVRLTRLFAAR